MFEMQLRSASVRPGPRLPCNVGAQRVRRAQSRPLANQHHRNLRAQRRADLIADRHAALLDHANRREPPAIEPRQQLREQRQRMPLHRQRGKPVGDNQRQIHVGPQPARPVACRLALIEPAAQVGPLQICRAVRSGRMQAQDVAARQSRQAPPPAPRVSMRACTASRACAWQRWKSSRSLVSGSPRCGPGPRAPASARAVRARQSRQGR